jgi:hypothetical protein
MLYAFSNPQSAIFNPHFPAGYLAKKDLVIWPNFAI